MIASISWRTSCAWLAGAASNTNAATIAPHIRTAACFTGSLLRLPSSVATTTHLPAEEAAAAAEGTAENRTRRRRHRDTGSSRAGAGRRHDPTAVLLVAARPRRWSARHALAATAQDFSRRAASCWRDRHAFAAATEQLSRRATRYRRNSHAFAARTQHLAWRATRRWRY